MKIAKLMLAAAASCMAVSPVMAAPANPAASLSVAKSVRAGSATAKDSNLNGGGGFLAAAIAAGVAAIVVIAVVIDEDDNNSDSN